ncbi:ribonuclease 2-like [Oryza brachyantha]|uniref:ribonuclease 2-like n=1 Tax=Oryza brachyantha TaxID=4533 RepID=UPI001ADB8B1F|nr:ribonuclease 2-like [Oryza brachyantha]XP_040376495.1 ribonuclease 2-like [Oryza brachyantha]
MRPCGGRRRMEKRRLVIPLAALCLAAVLSGALPPPPLRAAAAGGVGRKRRWAGFDYYVLALQWPGTVCRQTSQCCSSNGCCRSHPLKFFTIHGLWPQYSYGGWPSCCRPTTFDDNKISRLKTILEEYWPSLYCGSFSTCFGGKRPFWVHEWETHGTCGYPEIQDEYDYFSTALYLYSKYNVTKALRKAHIYPRGGRKYLVSHIVSAIEFSFGAMPSIVCKNGSVQELRLCFHKDYQLRDCVVEGENSVNRRSHCPRYVTLPSYKPHAISDSTEGISNQVNVEHQSFE